MLGTAGTFGFKLQLPKHLAPGTYRLRLTYVPDGATSGSTKTIPIKLLGTPTRRGHAPPKRSARRAVAQFEGPVNVNAGPPMAGYGAEVTRER